MDDLDPSIHAYAAGQSRLGNFRLNAEMLCGYPAVRIAGRNSGSTTVGAPGISLEMLDEACNAFNAVLLVGNAPAPFPLVAEILDAVESRRAAYVGSGAHAQDEAARQAEPVT